VKINGKVIEKAPPEVIVIPRQTGDIVFKAQAILDYTDFDAACPLPKAPTIHRPGQETPVLNPEDPKYKEKLLDWAEKKTDWMVLKSLLATDGLEWSTVDMSKPDTWSNYKKEMATSGFSEYEINRIMDKVFSACGLSTTKIDIATQNFLASQAAKATK